MEYSPVACMRLRPVSNSAKVAKILKNSFPKGSPGS